MRRHDTVYENLGYWYLSLIALVIAGFYYTYFAIFLQPRPVLIHIHFILMALWILTLIIQPFLIKFRNKKLHREIGKASFILVPFVLAVTFLVIRQEYQRNVNTMNEMVSSGLSKLTEADILRTAAKNHIGLFYFGWFALFYLLAMLNRYHTSVHIRYILATSLTLLGPTIDRILFINLDIQYIAGTIPSYAAAFIITDAVLIIMLIRDIKNNKPIVTLLKCLSIYLTGQILYFIVPEHDWWASFMSVLLKTV